MLLRSAVKDFFVHSYGSLLVSIAVFDNAEGVAKLDRST